MAASPLLPEILRGLGLLARQACRGNFKGQVLGYGSATGKTLLSLLEHFPMSDMIILRLGDGETPCLEVQS